MTEVLSIRKCPLCTSDLAFTYDPITGDLSVRAENVTPLAKEILSVVTAYKRLKGLGSHWTKAHGSRALIYSAGLLEAMGSEFGALERAIDLMEWLQSTGRDWSLDSAKGFIGDFQIAQKAAKEKTQRKCVVCVDDIPAEFYICERHNFCMNRDKPLPREVKPRLHLNLPHCGCDPKQTVMVRQPEGM